MWSAIRLGVDDVDLDQQLAAVAMYPNDGDFGFLNQLGHDAKEKIATARRLLQQ